MNCSWPAFRSLIVNIILIENLIPGDTQRPFLLNSNYVQLRCWATWIETCNQRTRALHSVRESLASLRFANWEERCPGRRRTWLWLFYFLTRSSVVSQVWWELVIVRWGERFTDSPIQWDVKRDKGKVSSTAEIAKHESCLGFKALSVKHR